MRSNQPPPVEEVMLWSTVLSDEATKELSKLPGVYRHELKLLVIPTAWASRIMTRMVSRQAFSLHSFC